MNLQRVFRVSSVASLLLLAVNALAQSAAEPALFAGKPNLNGIWQAMGTAHWNLEAHSMEAVPAIWQLGGLSGIPAGQSYVVGGKIPYLPQALAQRDANKAGWPATDPATSCYMPGIPRATYMPYPFQIIQGDQDILFAYAFATSNRAVHMSEVAEAPIDMWMGWSRGKWEGDTLVIEVTSNDDRTWLDAAGNYHSYMMKVTERYTPMGPNHLQYEATIEDPEVYSEPWTIRLPLYRNLDPNAELLEYKCVEFAEKFLYGEFEKTE